MPGIFTMMPNALFKKKRFGIVCSGGEGEIRTLATVSRPTPLAGAPLHQLEYFSAFGEMDAYI